MRNFGFFGRGSALPRLAMSMADGNGGGGGQGNGGGGEPSWTEALPEAVREWDEVKNSDAPEKFWDQMVNMRSHLGSSIRIPGEDAGKEDIAAFHEKLKNKVPGLMETPDFENDEALQTLYSRMGRPKEAKDYAIPELKDSLGNVIENVDTGWAESFKELAYKAGLSQQKYADIVSAVAASNAAQNAKVLEAQAADKAELEKEWGAAFDRNTKIVETFIMKSDAPDSLKEAMKSGTVGKDIMVWMHNLASQTLGNGSDFQGDDSNKGVMTPEEATIRISEIRNNKEHPYNKKNDPGHAAAMKQMRQLYELKNPTSGKNAAPGTTFGIGG